MKYSILEIPEIILCEPIIHKDNRGFVYESFKRQSFENFLGYKVNFCQDNISYSKFGVIRGLHTNKPEFSQSKLISVLNGKILDIVVDFRVGSPTFGKHLSIELSNENKKQLFVPSGFLHGFSVLSNEAIVMMKIDRYFQEDTSIGVRYNDKDLSINWRIQKKFQILSNSDLNLETFNKISSPFKYNLHQK